MDTWTLATVGLVSYVLGSIPSGVIAARAFRRVDVRTSGSGHTGAINTYRAAGIAPAVLTFLADGGKGIIAITAARRWMGGEWVIPIAATLVVIGHCYPIFARFRGGMGLTTAGGVFLVMQPLLLAALILAWFPIRYVLRELLRPVCGEAAPQWQRNSSLLASLAVALVLPVALLVTSGEEFVRIAGIGVGAVLFLRHLQVLYLNRLPVRSPG
jgi:glycerol-3-phosphate acyltransferase PlsY